MAKDYGLPTELQDTHHTVSQISDDAGPEMVRDWLAAMCEYIDHDGGTIQVVRGAYGSNWYVVAINDLEPETEN